MIEPMQEITLQVILQVVIEREKEEIKEVFAEYGLSEQSQDLIVNELAKDKHKWVDFMMKFELWGGCSWLLNAQHYYDPN